MGARAASARRPIARTDNTVPAEMMALRVIVIMYVPPPSGLQERKNEE